MVSARFLRDQISSACAVVMPYMLASESRAAHNALVSLPTNGRARNRHLRAILSVVSGSWLYDRGETTDLRGRSTLANAIGLSGNGEAFLSRATVTSAALAITQRAAAGQKMSRG